MTQMVTHSKQQLQGAWSHKNDADGHTQQAAVTGCKVEGTQGGVTQTATHSQQAVSGCKVEGTQGGLTQTATRSHRRASSSDRVQGSKHTRGNSNVLYLRQDKTKKHA